MFVGHYGVSFVAKRYDSRLPLWLLFLAVQLLDVLWAHSMTIPPRSGWACGTCPR